MRIIGGTLGGRTIRAPRGVATRPTSDRVREAIFSILGAPSTGLTVLDLFAGAGGLGLEALSRGATAAVFVDSAIDAVRCVAANAAALGVEGRVRVIRSAVKTALTRLCQEGATFGWIFTDPPYAGDDTAATLSFIGEAGAALLADTALVVVEHDRRCPPVDGYGVLAKTDRRRYGDTEISFYRRTA